MRVEHRDKIFTPLSAEILRSICKDNHVSRDSDSENWPNIKVFTESDVQSLHDVDSLFHSSPDSILHSQTFHHTYLIVKPISVRCSKKKAILKTVDSV